MSSNATKLLVGDYGPRTLLRLSGADAITFLHNLCTQDIRAMKEGDCSEAFITNVQGKTLGYVRVFRQAEGCFLESSVGQAPVLLSHFDKYQIREKVEFEDFSSSARGTVASWELLHAFLKSMQSASPSEGKYDLVGSTSSSIVANVNIAGPGLGYAVFSDDCLFANWGDFLTTQGANEMSPGVVETRRIAAGSVEFGRDISSDNLPQEIGRDTQAISFKKGCYLGQETVARIDALGHVNKILVRLRGEGKLAMNAGDALVANDKTVGNVTSAAWLEEKNETWALGFVRRGHHLAGSEVLVNGAMLKVAS